MENAHLIFAGLAVGLPGLGVAIGEALVAKRAIHILGKNPELSGTLLVYTILSIALVESAAIYGLIVALNIASNPDLLRTQGLGAAAAVGIAGFGVALGEAWVASTALKAIHRNPDIK
jgi:F0F1-type ATP synthase membrane subunit c/vacuolar-type H+-ATPase subunit K